MAARCAMWMGLSILLLLGACARRASGTLSFAVGGAPEELRIWEELIRDFEKESGYKVTLLRQPADTDQRRQGLLIPLKAHQSDPDVFLADVAWLTQFAASGWLEPLDSYVARDHINLAAFFPSVLNQIDRYQGHVVALPQDIDGGVLFYRKDLLKKAPETWDELITTALHAQAKELQTHPNFYGYVWQGAQYEGLICNFLEVAESAGGGITIFPQGVEVDSDANRRALALMRNFIHRYMISPPETFSEMREEESRIYFQDGKALYERNWPYAWSLTAGAVLQADQVGLAPLPHFPGHASVATLGGWHVAISRFSDAKPQAWAWAKYIVSYRVQKRLALALGWSPGRSDLYSDPDILKKWPQVVQLKEIFQSALARPAVPYYSQISSRLVVWLNAAIAGRLTPEEALAGAQRDLSRIAARYRGSS